MFKLINQAAFMGTLVREEEQGERKIQGFVRKEGLEPPRREASEPKSDASAIPPLARWSTSLAHQGRSQRPSCEGEYCWWGCQLFPRGLEGDAC